MPNKETTKQIDIFERYLTLWVVLCMGAGIIIGHWLPSATDALRRMEFGTSSHINIVIAVLLWLMIYPMMLKVDFGSIMNIRRQPRGLGITLVVNWLVKPFKIQIGRPNFLFTLQPL